MEFFSQFGQDRFVDECVFRCREGGFFVDIGAHDGITLSNSCFFERHRRWQGICVEPLPDRFAELRANRTAHCVNACIDSRPGVRSFTAVPGNAEHGNAEMLSGLSDSLDDNHKRRIEAELTAGGGGQVQTFDVQCIDINAVLADHGVSRVDYCSIDTEGHEFPIIQSWDLCRFPVTCFTIEDNGPGRAVRRHMESKGYVLTEHLGCDLVYVTRDHAATMGHVGLLKPGEHTRRFIARVIRKLGRIPRGA